MSAGYLVPLDLPRNRIPGGAVLAAATAILLALSLSRTVARPLEGLSHAALRIQRGRWIEPVGYGEGVSFDSSHGPWSACAWALCDATNICD